MPTKKRINSRQKGKRIELDACKFLRSFAGVEARRGQQFKGGADSPDIVTNIPGVYFEVKGVEGMDVGTKVLSDAVYKVSVEARPLLPVVLWRRNRGQWRVSFRSVLDHWIIVTSDATEWMHSKGYKKKAGHA